jgi:hypothetical protein
MAEKAKKPRGTILQALGKVRLVTITEARWRPNGVGILGQGFSSSSVVKFGGTAATTRQLTGSTFILATVPAGALTGNVTVTTGTTTLTAPKQFKVAPTFATFTPPSGPVGASVTITGPEAGDEGDV